MPGPHTEHLDPHLAAHALEPPFFPGSEAVMSPPESRVVRRVDVSTPRWEVVYVYTTPDYSRRKGFDIVRRYRAVFVVQTISEEHARAEAKILFREAALRSGVSWARVVESVTCRQLDEGQGDG